MLVAILVFWRNQLVHEERSANALRARVDTDLKGKLRAAGPELRGRYGDFEVEMLLEHFERNKAPSRKDMVALASAAQNYVREVDNALLRGTIVSIRPRPRVAEHSRVAAFTASDRG